MWYRSIVAAILVACPVFATAGDLDGVFGELGVLGEPLQLAAEPSGAVLVRVGLSTRTAVVRTSAQGTGAAKLFENDLTTVSDPGLVVLPGGKVLVSGYLSRTHQGYVEKHAASGALDATFAGGSGRALFPGGVVQSGPVVHADGTILVGGSADGLARLVRYRADGTLDPTFGDGGVVTGPVGGFLSIAVGPDGATLAMTSARLLRYRADGSLDPRFGRAGEVDLTPHFSSVPTLDPGGLPSCSGPFEVDAYLSGAPFMVRRQGSGKIVLVGTFKAGGQRRLRVVRLEADGPLDTSVVAGTGRRDVRAGSRPVFSGHGPHLPLALQNDGSLLITGNTDRGPVIVRYGADLADDGFAPVGSARGVFSLPNGRILTVGTGASSSDARSSSTFFALDVSEFATRRAQRPF
jgi:uncharacterized delta-60 repeat protein